LGYHPKPMNPPVLVQKFGGTSVGDPERIRRVARLILGTAAGGRPIVAVCSAMAGETNRLVDLAHALHPNPASREYDMLLASGEQVAIALLSLALNAEAGRSIAVPLLASQIGIRTDGLFSRARIEAIDTRRIKDELAAGRIPVVAGFQGVDAEGNITTLGRGGSDTSAVAIAAALRRDGTEVECEIYTDVDGVYTTDPRLCDRARRIERISHDEMMELASLGAKVLQIRSVELAARHGVPVHVRSTFDPTKEGTHMTSSEPPLEDAVVTGVAAAEDQTKLTLRRLPDRPGVAADIFGALAERGIDVDVIVQDSSTDGRVFLSFTVQGGDRVSACQALVDRGYAPEVEETQLSKVSVVGAGMRNHPGVAARMFRLLAEADVNIKLVTTSEIKISCMIAASDTRRAVEALHRGFGLDAGDT
jgi:aspartate kinase